MDQWVWCISWRRCLGKLWAFCALWVALCGASGAAYALNLDILFKRPADLSLGDYAETSRMREASIIERIDLKDAIRAAMTHSNDVKAAQSRLEGVQAQYGRAWSALLPNVTIRRTRGKETSAPASIVDNATGESKASDTHIRTDDVLTLNQPLVDLPNSIEVMRRRKLMQSQEITYRVAQEDLVLQVAQAYLGLMQARLIHQAAEDQAAELDELRKYVEKRAAAGAISVSEADRVRARMLSLRSSILDLQGGYFTALKEFSRLTGLAPRWLAIPDGRLAYPAIPGSADAAVDYARQHSPEVQAVVVERQALQNEAQSVLGRMLPKVNFEFSNTHSTNAGGNPITQKDRRAFLVFSWNLFAGGGDYFDYQQTSAKRRESTFKLADFREKLEQSISSAYRLWRLNEERLSMAEQEHQTTSKVADSFREQLGKGARPLLDVLDALDRDYQAKVNYLKLQVMDITYRYQVVRQLGLGMRLTGLDPNAAINFPILFPELVGDDAAPAPVTGAPEAPKPPVQPAPIRNVQAAVREEPLPDPVTYDRGSSVWPPPPEVAPVFGAAAAARPASPQGADIAPAGQNASLSASVPAGTGVQEQPWPSWLAR
jgi:outer membrane protein TolC